MCFSHISVGGGITGLETIISAFSYISKKLNNSKVKKIIDRKTTKITATKIRVYAKQKFGQKYIKVLSKINVNDLRKIES